MAVASLKEAASTMLQSSLIATKIQARLTKQETTPSPTTPDTTVFDSACKLAAAEVQAVIGDVADADIDDDTEVEYIRAVDLTARLALLRLQATWSGSHNADVTAEIRHLKSELAEWGETLSAEADSLVVVEHTSDTRTPLERLVEKLYPAVEDTDDGDYS